MSFDKHALGPYMEADGSIIPVHPWNKMHRGSQIGKLPLHDNWTKRQYKTDDIVGWIDAGYNLGYRIDEHEVVLDLDPRNYDEAEDVEGEIAKLLGYSDFDDIEWDHRMVHTGGDGYHIYLMLPKSWDYKELCEVVEGLSGVELKRKGRQVLCAGSRHPNGDYYQWLNDDKPREAPIALLERFKRQNYSANQSTIHEGLKLSGTQLQELVLDKLDVGKFDTNDKWWPILCACYHVTGGTAIDEFVEWSLADGEYRDDEHLIRLRWDSLDPQKAQRYEAGTLIMHIDKQGEDSSPLRSVLTFNEVKGNDFDDDEDIDDEETDATRTKDVEKQMLEDVKALTQTINIDEIAPSEVVVKAGVDGEAIKFCLSLFKGASMEDKTKAIRLIKAATVEEALEAQEILIDNKVMSQSSINKRLKSLETVINDSIPEVLANTTIHTVFREGRDVILEPNGQFWIYKNTHWLSVSDAYLGKIIYTVLNTLKSKMDFKVDEPVTVRKAIDIIRFKSALLISKIFDPGRFLPVINCLNGEVWINKDGSHTLKRHSRSSYQISCLNVDYDPSADCPLFNQTLSEIFAYYDDADEIIEHLWEMLGYVIQPYKPDANWWMLKGPGGDGKSTILKVLAAILGDAYLPAEQKLLKTNNSTSDNHVTTRLIGVLGVAIEELSAGVVLDDSGLKTLSENCKKTANPKGKDTFTFNYVGTLLMCSNFYPHIRDSSEGTLRRANVIPFNRQFKKNGLADLDRPNDIVNSPTELAGVLNNMLKGYQRYKNRGYFKTPASCELAKHEWLADANNVYRFVSEYIDVTEHPKDCVGNGSEIYNLYENWSHSSGLKSMSRNRFYSELRNFGLITERGSGNKMTIFGGCRVDIGDDSDDDFSDI